MIPPALPRVSNKTGNTPIRKIQDQTRRGVRLSIACPLLPDGLIRSTTLMWFHLSYKSVPFSTVTY